MASESAVWAIELASRLAASRSYTGDSELSRLRRDAPQTQIGEGANEVLKAFIALVGMRDVGEGLKSTLEGLKRPARFVPTLWRFGRERMARLAIPPRVPVASSR